MEQFRKTAKQWKAAAKQAHKQRQDRGSAKGGVDTKKN